MIHCGWRNYSQCVEGIAGAGALRLMGVLRIGIGAVVAELQTRLWELMQCAHWC